MRTAVASADFPLPKDKVIIDQIETSNTPGQIVGFMQYLRDHPEVKKVAVVSSIAHSRRVGRYLEDYKLKHPELFRDDVAFLNAWMSPGAHNVGITLKEMKKIKRYAEKGDLAEDFTTGILIFSNF